MNSDDVLTQLRAATQKALGIVYDAAVPTTPPLTEALTELAELFDNFDQNLTHGGALPKDWTRLRPTIIESREIVAKALYSSIHAGGVFPWDTSWEKLADCDREGWLVIADAAITTAKNEAPQ